MLHHFYCMQVSGERREYPRLSLINYLGFIIFLFILTVTGFGFSIYVLRCDIITCSTLARTVGCTDLSHIVSLYVFHLCWWAISLMGRCSTCCWHRCYLRMAGPVFVLRDVVGQHPLFDFYENIYLSDFHRFATPFWFASCLTLVWVFLLLPLLWQN